MLIVDTLSTHLTSTGETPTPLDRDNRDKWDLELEQLALPGQHLQRMKTALSSQHLPSGMQQAVASLDQGWFNQWFGIYPELSISA